MIDSFEDLKSGMDKRGMVGIGTLIVFIAVVIVAAVAAGVLINTSGTLQQQARATGQETITEVSSGVQVVAAKGKTNSDSKIWRVDIVVQTYPGSQGVNFDNTVIQVKTDESMAHLTSDNFSVTKIENVSGTKPYYLSTGDTSKISIDFSGEDNNDVNPNLEISPGLSDNLTNSEDASIQIIPAHGFETYYGIQAPPTMSGNKWYEL